MSLAPAKPRCIAWGELVWDLFPDGSRLGGSAANFAYHAAQLGADSHLVSRVGKDDLGARALQELARHGVQTGSIEVDLDPTGSVQIEIEDGQPRYRGVLRARWDRIPWRPELGELFASASVLCFGTVAQRGPLGFDVIERALAHAPAGSLRLCDLNVREPSATRAVVERAISLANAVKLNQDELALIGRLFDQPDVVSWLLAEHRLDFVALTRGARGALLATPSERLEHPGFPLSSTEGDSVGAGDGFNAHLCLSLHDQLPLATCLERANEYAAQVASRRGGMA